MIWSLKSNSSSCFNNSTIPIPLRSPRRSWAKKDTCAIYLIPEGFPENTNICKTITIPIDLEDNLRIAYVDKVTGGCTTTKKRSFIVVGTSDTIVKARKNVYNLIPESIKGIRFRTDIAAEFDTK